MANVTPRQAAWAGLTIALLCATSACSNNKSTFASASPIERDFVAAVPTWDLNKDGDVTCDEWRQYVAGLFREADLNHDGVLTREEFAIMGKRDRLFETVGFDYFDTNGAGRLTVADIADRRNPAFTLLDSNNDCVLTPEERRQPGGKAGPKGKRG
jgi:Ca2+-binding EF-hand superfamily protein